MVGIAALKITINSFTANTHAGHHFALLSGTSMATPHVAGIAALIIQQNPSWTPSIIASAISTTSTKHDNLGQPLMAEGFEMNSLHSSTPFEHGAGLVNPSRAIDPGLVFSSGTLLVSSVAPTLHVEDMSNIRHVLSRTPSLQLLAFSIYYQCLHVRFSVESGVYVSVFHS